MNGKTGLNPSKDEMKKNRDSQRQLASQIAVSYLILSKERRLLFEKLNFCNIMDLQPKLSTSKATSTTVQDVHPDIASQRDNEKPRLYSFIGYKLYSYITFCLRPELTG